MALAGRLQNNEFISSLSKSEIASLAKTDIGYRYALVNLNPFAITGNDSLYDADALSLYNPETGTGQLTEEYLKDRAEMLRVLIQFNLENEDYESGEVSLGGVFIDTDYIDKEQALDLEVDANGFILSNRQVVFGSETGESILGGDQADRLYGMGGGDWITGGEGKDYIEGGDGEDTLEGGEGKDVLKGGRGRDYIEGGAGDDILIEGQNAEFDMGSNDLLKGGAGFDTYIVGAGDIIEDDAANEGKVQFKDIDLSGVKNQLSVLAA